MSAGSRPGKIFAMRLPVKYWEIIADICSARRFTGQAEIVMFIAL
jgi:hypothetical protein